MPEVMRIVTAFADLPEIPRGSRYAAIVIDGFALHDQRELVLAKVRRKLTLELGCEPAVVALLDREQAEWVLSEAQPDLPEGGRLMIAVAFHGGGAVTEEPNRP
ncbi:MAG: hypothetical protein JWN00_3492 [Actinomycetia bacterium]|nr:hypothetical protein [Actinomycetes bacterium]